MNGQLQLIVVFVLEINHSPMDKSVQNDLQKIFCSSISLQDTRKCMWQKFCINEPFAKLEFLMNQTHNWIPSEKKALLTI